MTIDWNYLAIIAIWVSATIAYAFHDGPDPFVAAFFGTLILAYIR